MQISERIRRKAFRSLVLPLKRLGFSTTAPTPRFDAVLAALRAEGGAVTHVDDLAIPGTARMLAAATSIAEDLASFQPTRGGKTYVMHALEEQLMAHPEIVAWGLEEALLDMVESYIGLPAAYRGVTLRRDLADGSQIETRLWHRDDEDDRIVKLIVYLNDVDSGAYEFAPRRYRFATPYRVSDAEFDAKVPQTARVRCTGPAGTAVVTDTCNVFHRGGVPRGEDRYTLFFSYNSIYPKNPQYCGTLFNKPELLRRAILSPRQRAAIA